MNPKLNNKKTGKVFLIGVGPGDIGLLTLRGKWALQQSDIIIYDSLINSEILNFAPKNSKLIFRGYRGENHALSQHQLNFLLIKYAKKGYSVSRLKGGDPFILGRGGEEAEYLKKFDIPFEVIPGVSSVVGVPAYAGIPLTHRDYSDSFLVISAVKRSREFNSAILSESILKYKGTIVILMGFYFLKEICEGLIHIGKNSKTPIAVIQNGTFASQKIVIGSLEDISQKVKNNKIQPPIIIIIGDVVRLSEKMNWIKNKPLFGKRILITRDSNQNQDIRLKLVQLGAEVVEIPMIEILPLPVKKEFNEMIQHIQKYPIIIFSSSNGVELFFEKILEKKQDARVLHNSKIICVGTATEKRLKSFGVIADWIPEKFNQNGVLKYFENNNFKNDEILMIGAKNHREDLVKSLNKIKIKVKYFPIYKTSFPRSSAPKIEMLFKRNESIDLIVFFSPSAVEGFFSHLPHGRYPIKKIKFAVVGPTTLEKLKQYTSNVPICSLTATTDSLIYEIQKYFNEYSLNFIK